MKHFNRFLYIFLCILIIIPTSGSFTQSKTPDIYRPLMVRLDSTGSSYLRFLLWNQFWVTTNNLAEKNAGLQCTPGIRRARLIAYAQLSPRFMVLTHIGLNSLNPENLTTLGSNGDAAQIFLHGAWAELKVFRENYIGGGLHYWNSMTRLASASTVSFATLDQSRPFIAYHSLGITDQFARHLGIYWKGTTGRLHYRLAWNSPGRQSLNDGLDYSGLFKDSGEPASELSYTGVNQADKKGNATGRNIYAGYIKYDFLEQEATKLPYFTGNYLGAKKVLAMGAGFFLHPNGMFNTITGAHSGIKHFALDLFADHPIPSGAVQAYAAFQKFDYGENYISRWAGTGNAWFGQIAYYMAAWKTMPYAAYAHTSFEGAETPVQALDLGVNYFVSGHHCKITLEWHRIIRDYRESEISYGGTDHLEQIRMQFQVFL